MNKVSISNNWTAAICSATEEIGKTADKNFGKCYSEKYS